MLRLDIDFLCISTFQSKTTLRILIQSSTLVELFFNVNSGTEKCHFFIVSKIDFKEGNPGTFCIRKSVLYQSSALCKYSQLHL